MELTELHKQIFDKRVSPLLILTGKEIGVLDIYLKKLIDASGRKPEHSDTVLEAYQRMVKKSMTASRRLFLVRGDDAFIKQEKVWAQVFSAATDTNSLVLVLPVLDKRSKFYKQYAHMIVEFEPVSPGILCKYVETELPGLSTNGKMRLIETCESDYSRILLECDKIRQYTDAQDPTGHISTYDDVLKVLIEDGTIFQPIGDITFKLTDAILTRNYKNTGKYLLQARSKGEPEIMVLSILYNSFKQMLMVQGLGPDTSDACKRTGLTSWQVKMAKEKMGAYTVSDLVHALKTTRFVEMGIKTGQVDADVSLEYLIINVM